MSHHIFFGSLVAVAAPAIAFAQVPASTVGEVVVTASRLSRSAEATAYSVRIIPQAEIIGRTSVTDALAQTADVYVQAPGGASGVASIFLRGSDPNFTAVLLDGVPLNNPTNTRGGSVNVSELSTAGLERIEIVSGPLSSLYGSGALAGAVNLMVPGGQADHGGEARLGFGTDEDYTGFARWRGPLPAGYGGSLAVSIDDAGDETESSSFKSQSLLGKISPLAGDDAGRVIFRIASTDARAFPESSGGPRLAVLRETDHRKSREGLIGVDHQLFARGSFRFDVAASFLERWDQTTSPGVAPSEIDPMGVPGGEDETKYRRGIVQAVARHQADGWSGLAGVEAQREEARSAGELDFGFPVPSGFKGDRSTYSGFLEASRATQQWVLSGGARVDQIDGLGTHLTARAAVRYNLPGSGFSLRGAAGTGFKAPSFYALGNPFVGNPDLGPEKSRAGEVGVLWRGSRGDTAAVTAYYARYTGLIDFVPGPPPRLENRSVVVSKGVSATATKSLGARLTAQAQIQYADTRDEGTDARLLNRPRWRAASTVTWRPADRVTVIARYSSVGERDDYSVPTGVMSLAGYRTISVDAAWDIVPSTSLRLIVDNALDDDHEDAIGFPSPGRRARILVSREF